MIFKMDENADFIKDLNSPVHSKIKNINCTAGKKEFLIDKSWSIAVKPDSQIEVLTAAEDLADFFEAACNLILPVFDESIPGEKCIEISAGKDTTSPPSAKDEGFTLKITRNKITIKGNGSCGALYGAFELENLIKQNSGPVLTEKSIKKQPSFAPRILRSFYAPYWTETIDCKDHYSDNYLSRLAHQGYDAIWLRAELRELSKCSSIPEFGQKSEKLTTHLNKLIDRAKRWGIGIHLYFCEPHGIRTDDKFWKKNKDIKGSHGKELGVIKDFTLNALCTTSKRVKNYLREASYNLFKNCPSLEGVFLITSSEHTGHCKQRSPMFSECPRCKDRKPSEIITEIITLVRDGIRKAGSNAHIMAWDWSWCNHVETGGIDKIIEQMPTDVDFMSNVEWGGEIERFGVKQEIREYSLCYPGPAKLFKDLAVKAQKAKHKVAGKIQINATHEFASMPYMPVPYLLGEKFKGLKKAGVEKLLCCWIFGNYPSLGTEMANAFMWDTKRKSDTIIEELALKHYGKKAYKKITKAWKHFSDGYAYYPFDYVYLTPLPMSIAHPFYLKPARRIEPSNWIHDRGPYGDYLGWCGAFGPEVVKKCHQTALNKFNKCIKIFSNTLTDIPASLKAQAAVDLNLIKAIALHYRSIINWIDFARLRDRIEFSKSRKKICNMIKTVDSFYAGKDISEEDIGKALHNINMNIYNALPWKAGTENEINAAHKGIYKCRDLKKGKKEWGNFKSLVTKAQENSIRTPKQTAAAKAKMIAIIKDEISAVKEYLKLRGKDSRLGFHSEAGYLFTPADLRRKLKALQAVKI
ncbi:MAG: glycoside hydrolase family 20 zincin-like fold domain-containing protein [Planctomycetota bacterium]|jgi:hypothetical protein